MHINYIFLIAVPMDCRSPKSPIFCMQKVLPTDTSCSRQLMSYARLPPVQRCSTTHVNSHPSVFAGNRNSAKSALSWHAPGGLSVSHIEPAYSSGKWSQEGLRLCLGLKCVFKRMHHGISNHCVLPRPLFFSVTKYP